MTLDFRCEKCGKMLKVEAEAGGRVRCSNCRRWAKVPALLGRLPHPHIPTEAAARSVQIAVKDEPDEAGSVSLSAIGTGMPWVISAIMHVGVFLIMLFIVMIARTPLRDVDRPGAVADPPPVRELGKFEEAAGSSQSAAPKVGLVKVAPWRDVAISPGASENAVELVEAGVGHSRTGSDLQDGLHPGGGLYGLGPGVGRGGGARNVVYVIDRSGSMSRTFEEVKAEMIRSISRLSPRQRFHIVLFGDGQTIEGPRRGLVEADLENKLAAVEFLRETAARGTTTALVALQRSLAVLSSRPAGESKLIYLLSDGDFSGLSGGSRYRTADGQTLDGNEAVLQWLADNNKGPKVHINTLLLHSTDATAVRVLRAIAESNGGRFKRVSPDE